MGIIIYFHRINTTSQSFGQNPSKNSFSENSETLKRQLKLKEEELIKIKYQLKSSEEMLSTSKVEVRNKMLGKILDNNRFTVNSEI